MAFKTTFINAITRINKKINTFFTFLLAKLKNFKNLTPGEQISYSSIGVGLVLIVVSMVLFII